MKNEAVVYLDRDKWTTSPYVRVQQLEDGTIDAILIDEDLEGEISIARTGYDVLRDAAILVFEGEDLPEVADGSVPISFATVGDMLGNVTITREKRDPDFIRYGGRRRERNRRNRGSDQ